MKTRVVVGERVKNFLESLPPEPRRKLWRAIKGLPEGKGDIKQLEGRLAPYWRLRAISERRGVSADWCVILQTTGQRSIPSWSSCWHRA